jgi:serine/threonine protein kinase
LLENRWAVYAGPPMTGERIADRELARGAPVQTRGPSRVARLSAAIASPAGALTLLPLLVAAVGLFLTLVGQRALRESNLTMASERLDEEAALLARGIGSALEESDPMMDRLAALALDHDSIKSYDRVAHTLHDLMQGRAGVAYISISFPDGTFQGAYRDQDGSVRFQDCRVTPKGSIVKRYTLVGHERIVPYFEETNQYDPRSRPFYALALTTHERVWTKPYPFFKTNYTGITRAQAVYDPATSELHAVITVDFNIATLSAALNRISMGGATTLLFANDGTVLAYPRGEGTINNLPAHRDRALSYRDLNDPLLNAFFEPSTRQSSTFGLRRLAVGNEHLLVAQKRIPDDSLPWSVATLMPEAEILSTLHAHQTQGLLAAGIATLLASGLAWLFARRILRARFEIAAARAEAREAAARANELGSYRLVQLLGKGGMGEVWRAEHRLLVRQAAIKLIVRSTDAGLDPAEMQERFRREAQSLATLRSRNTIELFDYGVTSDGTCFYVMELLDGMDLETLIERYGPQPAARVIQFLIQACNSLAEAHGAGLVHRDIKPANLYVCRAADEVDVIKVLDFGLVRAAVHPTSLPTLPEPKAAAHTTELESGVHVGAGSKGEARITQVGQAMGTPAYMAPEQALGHELDGRADLYALACVGFFLLSGRLLFQKSGSLPMMMAHITEEPPEFENCIPNYLPPELTTVLLRCLAKKPEDRPNDARALANALKSIPISERERWTDAQAQAWWATRPPKPPPREPPPSAEAANTTRGVA